MTVNMHRKGITAVVAIVLLLMMTVAAAGMAYMWVMGIQQKTAETTNEDLDRQQQLASTRLTIESIWKETAAPYAGNISFAVRNTGAMSFDNMTGFTVYIDGKMDTAAIDMTANGLGQTLSSNEVKAVKTKVPWPLTGKAVEIELVTPAGYKFSKKCGVVSSTVTTC